MKKSGLFLILLSFIFALRLQASYSSDNNSRLNPDPAPPVSLKAVRVSRGPDMDGSLSDPAWQEAALFSDFTQVFPANGATPTEKTELRILYDADNLYLGLYCYDRQPDKISANTLAHDADDEAESDDLVKILLDPFLDKRNSYLFIVNARGARSEGLAFGEHFSLSWDGIWEARARIQPDGWSVEIRIPFKTISFKPDLPCWGLNVERYIPRKQETIRLSGTGRDNFFYNAAEAAPLYGLNRLKLGKGITFKPYGTFRTGKNQLEGEPADYKLDGGFDLYKNFTPNFVGAASYNTDFAETEVDERRLNLTRFPLFYPEKRTFFLEGSEIFNFGTTGSSSFTPFFSRRIGLYQGQQIPVTYGLKSYGRLGNTNLALLHVRTEEFAELPAENFFAARIYQNILAESKVGFIFTHGSPDGEKNTLAGFDLIYQTSRLFGSQNFLIGGWFVHNWNGRESGKHHGFGFKIDYPNDLWDIVTSYSYYGDALAPGLGFLPRNNIQNWMAGISYMPRPEKGFVGRLVRQFYFQLRPSFYWDLQGRLETRNLEVVPLRFRTESGENFEFSLTSNRDLLPYDFEVAEGVVIPQGTYDFTYYKVELETATHRPLVLSLEQQFGQFYSGHLSQTEAGAAVKIKGYATLDFRADLVRGNLPQGKFKENVYELKLDLFLSPDLGLMNYFQYDDVSNKLGINIRFRWEIKPGNIIYLVYSKNWEYRRGFMDRFLPLEERGVFKIQLSIRP